MITNCKQIIYGLILFSTLAFGLDIKSNSYFLTEINSNKVLLEKQADLRQPIASITKIMTSYVVFLQIKSGKININDTVLISKKASKKGGSKMFIDAGSVVLISDLLKGMIISSGNDASIALAEYIAGSEEAFADLMNLTAKQLGMNNSNFKNSTGWPDDEHYSTPRDIAVVTRAMILEFPEYYEIFKEKEFTYGKSKDGIPITQKNRNWLLWSNGLRIDGVKTGHTEAAGYCLVGSAYDGDMRLVSVIMRTTSKNSRLVESERLLTHGLTKFSTKKIIAKNTTILTVPIWKGNKDNIMIGVVNDVYLTVEKGKLKRIKTNIKVDKNILAPLMRNSKIGEISYTLDGTLLKQEDLRTLEVIESGTFFNNLFDSIMLLLS